MSLLKAEKPAACSAAGAVQNAEAAHVRGSRSGGQNRDFSFFLPQTVVAVRSSRFVSVIFLALAGRRHAIPAVIQG